MQFGSAAADSRGEAPEDFAEFYAATLAGVLRTVRRLAGDHQHAVDATQEAYARMLERWPDRRCHAREANRRYTVAIASNLVIDWYRQTGRLAPLDEQYDVGEEDPGFETVTDELSTLRAVRDFIDRQPFRRRAVAVLFFLQQQTYAEVAQALGIKESTVRTHVERMRSLLKPYLDQVTEMERGGERS